MNPNYSSNTPTPPHFPSNAYSSGPSSSSTPPPPPAYQGNYNPSYPSPQSHPYHSPPPSHPAPHHDAHHFISPGSSVPYVGRGYNTQSAFSFFRSPETSSGMEYSGYSQYTPSRPRQYHETPSSQFYSYPPSHPDYVPSEVTFHAGNPFTYQESHSPPSSPIRGWSSGETSRRSPNHPRPPPPPYLGQ